jgi:hypothetical protein
MTVITKTPQIRLPQFANSALVRPEAASRVSNGLLQITRRLQTPQLTGKPFRTGRVLPEVEHDLSAATPKPKFKKY